MTDSEKNDLDRWIKKIGGEVNTWTTKDGVTHYEARVWKDGKVLRFLNTNRYQPIAALKVAWEEPTPASAPSKTRCSCCSQDATEEFKVRCSEDAATRVGIRLKGPRVDTTPSGYTIREETVSLCPGCMAVEMRRFIRLVMDPAEWLRVAGVWP